MCQSTFTLLISDSTDQRPADLIELSDHSYILSSFFYTSTFGESKQKFLKISSNGQIKNEMILENPDGAAMMSTMLPFNDTNIFCIGDWYTPNDKNKIWVSRIDSGFNMYWSKMYHTDYLRSNSRKALMNSQNQIVSATSGATAGYFSRIFLTNFSLVGDSLKSVIDSSASGPMLFDIIEFPGNGSYLEAVDFYRSFSPGQVISIDSLLNVIYVDSIPHRVYNCITMKKATDSTYYLSGTFDSYGDGSDYAIMLLDQNNDCLKISVIGKNDTMDYSGTFQSLDFVDPNKIFLAGTSNISLSGWFSNQHSWYALSSFDSVLNLRWTKYYGGDAYYVLTNVVATKDGGAILVGTRYDYLTQNNQLDIFLVKVDENGVITNVENQQFNKYHDVIIYPNPGSNYLVIESGQQICGAQFRMISINGKEVIHTSLINRRVKINTQNLSAGTYFWEILLNDRFVESGKWIKLSN